MRRTLCLVLAGAMMAVAWPEASAIIRRHDRDDARYIELGAKYPAVTRLGGDTATLVDPCWLVTAAHVTSALSPFDRAVRFGGTTYAIEAVVEHPRAHEAGGRQRMDLALIKLAKPVEGITPIGFYERDDEEGKPIVVAGFGMYGDGVGGPQGDDGRARAATNIVGSVLENYLVFPLTSLRWGRTWKGSAVPATAADPRSSIHRTGRGLPA